MRPVGNADLQGRHALHPAPNPRSKETGPKEQATHNANPLSASTASTASAPPLRAAEILRKIRLLSEVNTRNGASAAEADNAQRLARALMERYSIKAVEERPVTQQRPAAKLTWVYWQELFNEFCLVFSYLGYRGSATIGHDRIVYIKLGTGQWSVEKRTKDGGTQIVARDIGLETMRKYLTRTQEPIRSSGTSVPAADFPRELRFTTSARQSFLMSPVIPAMKMALSTHPAIICTQR